MKACPRHDEYQPECFACRIRTVHISAHATPTRRPGVMEIDAREARWDRDMPAYKRLRRQGLQPRGIDGCAELERRAETPAQVEHGLERGRIIEQATKDSAMSG